MQLSIRQYFEIIGETARRKAAQFLSRLLPADVYAIVDAAASSAQGLVANFTSAVGTRSDTAFVAGGVAALAAYPRNVTVTTGGGTPTQGYSAVVITGTDIDGNPLTETISGLAAGAATYQGNKAFKTITSAAWSGGTGAGATQSLGFGNKFGLPANVKERSGVPVLIRELQDGAPVGTAGTLVAKATGAPWGTYTPNAAPDASKDYVLVLEMDVTSLWP